MLFESAVKEKTKELQHGVCVWRNSACKVRDQTFVVTKDRCNTGGSRASYKIVQLDMAISSVIGTVF